MSPLICLLVVFLQAAVSVCQQERFLILAPSVFHVGVKERIYIQVGKALLNSHISLHLEHETSTTKVSEEVSLSFTGEGQVKTVELQVDWQKMSELPSSGGSPPSLLLVSKIQGVKERHMVRVLVSKRRGYIFIQTDQPIYNPSNLVSYRIFTLNHAMRPNAETVHISIFNAGGNQVWKGLKRDKSGIVTINFDIPDVSELGVWKIVAHYQGDERNAVTQQFEVKKFVLPSFEVTIKPEKGYILINTEQFTFDISALYSHGKTIKGAFHCRFGVKEKTKAQGGKEKTVVFIRGLEHTGLIRDGKGSVVLQISELIKQLQSQLKTTLSDLDESQSQLLMTVSVTDINSGELQEAEVYLPVVSQLYTVDLSRTRSHYIPGVPLKVEVVVHLPGGSPAVAVPVTMHLPNLQDDPKTKDTDKEGIVWQYFNLPNIDSDITVEVTVDGHRSTKVVKRSSFPGNVYLSTTVNDGTLMVDQLLTVTFAVINAVPEDGFIYYLVLSRGQLIREGSVKAGKSIKIQFPITHAMTPSFRLIGYYHGQNADIIADSVWVDVKDVCEGKVEVKTKKDEYAPGQTAKLDIDLNGQKAKVALLAVDKAMYALNAHNRLTPKQVFSSMQSYDLGCSYGGGSNTASVFNDAGLSFISSSAVTSQMRIGFNCEQGFRRQRRSLDLQQQMMSIKLSYSDGKLQECCGHGFTLIPMRRTCDERAKIVERSSESPACVQAFRECCKQGEKLREKKKRDDALAGHGRTGSEADIEDFFDTTDQDIRRYFPPSFFFKVVDVDGQNSVNVMLPDSITTWEMQVVSISASHGICVAEPYQLRVFKEVFVTLRLPYSVKRFEQFSVIPVVYNYGDEPAQIALQMVQNEKLCSPGSGSLKTYVNVTVEPHSSKAVTFTAVPMETGFVPIIIRLYDKENEVGSDAIEKTLNVRTEGIEKRVEEIHVVNLIGGRSMSLTIDGKLPDNTVPESISNIFVKMEGEGFGQSTAKTLLSPHGVKHLLQAPDGCAEQTMKRMAPTALTLRYLDLSQRWYELPAGTRDTALDSTEQGYMRILTFKKADGSYGAWKSHPTSHWLTGLVVKVMSLVAERQRERSGPAGREGLDVAENEISHSVRYLLDNQNQDGSFTDPNPVIHREMQGGIGGVEGDVSMTAFITLALNRSLPFLTDVNVLERTKATISRATKHLLSRFEGLKRPYSAAITAYALSVTLPDRTEAMSAWEKLQKLATKDKNNCSGWYADAGLVKKEKAWWVPTVEAITVETTAYALLTAVAHKKTEWADSAACWLTSQENYGGGFKSTQDTIVALEALSEYALTTPPSTTTQVRVDFTSEGRFGEILRQDMQLDNKGYAVEKELKTLIGKNAIDVNLTGQGKAKMKVTKVYHVLEPYDNCDLLSITVKVEGIVKYTARLVEDYYELEDYADDERSEEEDIPRSAIEWFDARSRRRRDTQPSLEPENLVQYEVCFRINRNLTGMAIADITLLSGFQAQTEDLDKLKAMPEQYISHYELSHDKVLMYFNKIEPDDCIAFRAKQSVPVGLLQPAPASIYDYYEPDRKCTIFYAAPKQSKMVSALCDADVCQCAERPCHKQRNAFGPQRLMKDHRFEFACFFPTVDYGFTVQVGNVSVKSNFALYSSTVTSILRVTGDLNLQENNVRVFARRLQCKGHLEAGKTYLIMGKDGLTTDSNGQMQYLLESNTWIEQVPDEKKCQANINKKACRQFHDFVTEYKFNGCSQ
ncbi:complement C4-B [Esox lucius]|uniref:Complement 4B (Chido blood group) n=1 Tax=Esox lucius TaxID=8010 RepID=A0A3P8XLF2_ESOLU|nr:complement C4-B [Esox lucius]